MFSGLQDHPSAGGRGGRYPDGESKVTQSYERTLITFSGNPDNRPTGEKNGIVS